MRMKTAWYWIHYYSLLDEFIAINNNAKNFFFVSFFPLLWLLDLEVRMTTLFYIWIYNKNVNILELSCDCININYLFDFRKHNNEKKNLKQRLHSQCSNWLIHARHYIQLVKKHNFSLQSYIAIIADADEDFAFIVSSKRTRGFQLMLDLACSQHLLEELL